MHSERDIYGDQLYTTALRENSRLAKAKITTVDEFDSNAQIYINVFERKSRLSCFNEITEDVDDEVCDFLSKESDESDKFFEDFGIIAKTTQIKKRTGKQQKKKTVVQEPHFNI